MATVPSPTNKSFNSYYEKLVDYYLMQKSYITGDIYSSTDFNEIVLKQCCTSYTFEDRHELDEAITQYDISGEINYNDDIDTLIKKCDVITKYGNPEYWNLENITDLSRLFQDIDEFPKVLIDALPHWDVSHVTNFSRMFSNCKDFNADITDWDTSSGENFSSMFENAVSYTHATSKWDLSNAKNINKMFKNAKSYCDDHIEWFDFNSVIKTKNHVDTFAGTRYHHYFVRLIEDMTQKASIQHTTETQTQTETQTTDIISVIGHYLKNPTDSDKVAQLIIQHMINSSGLTTSRLD